MISIEDGSSGGGVAQAGLARSSGGGVVQAVLTTGST